MLGCSCSGVEGLQAVEFRWVVQVLVLGRSSGFRVLKVSGLRSFRVWHLAVR